MIRVQQEDFDIGAEIERLKSGRSDIGAVVAFLGTVRDRAGDHAIDEMTLEHGTLRPSDNIVLVLTASEHRQAAFAAAEFLMDYLKTRAPFWKRESGPEGSRWVEANASDDAASDRWDTGKDAAE